MKIKNIFRSGEIVRKYIDDYKFKSIFVRNTILLMLVIMVPLAGIASLAYYAYGNMQENEIKAVSEKMTFDYYSDWERILKDARTELGYINFNSNVELFMYDTEELLQRNYKMSNIHELMMMPVVTKDYVDNIYIYANKSGKVITMEGVSNYNTFHGKKYMDQYLADDSRDIRVTQDTLVSYEKKQLSIFNKIRYGPKFSGLSVMHLNISDLRKEMKVPEHIRMYLIDGERVLYADDVELIGMPVERIPGYEHVHTDGTNLWKNEGICSMKAEQGDLEVVTFMETDGYRDRLSTIRNSMLLFLLFVTLLTILLSIVASVRIFSPISDIMSSLRKYQGELIGGDEQFQEKDELEYILQSIQRTVNVKRDIDQELAERVRLLKKAQAVALQSQINPHFMNNTLETINWMAIGLLGGKNEISEMTQALSKMLRMALGNTDTIIPMDVEIEHCMNYLEIQKIRYEDKFDVIWNIPDEIMKCKTIRIVLQPIVENAIYHGIKPLTNKGKITISGKLKEDRVILKVTDNGLGMTPEELESLRANMRSDIIKESRHIGVANVNQRLKLYFGEEYGVFIESGEGMGTTVAIEFPKIIS